MTDLIFTGTTEEGEKVEITLPSLLTAKWNWAEPASFRTASTLGEVSVLADSIQSADYDKLKAERDNFEDKLNQLETESHDATREFQHIVNELSALKAEFTAITADRDSEARWAKMYSGQAARLDTMVTKLRTALEFYADESNWYYTDDCDMAMQSTVSGPDIARAALEAHGE
ncbi:MAG: hypothetical protein JZU60_02020 [Ilumatobacteraceae bacterium]|jgi:septal ring factor EnvC (AmiA/AmiB activator)|nr:hypothetical protein [Ilumatobacteraceae bacterium]